MRRHLVVALALLASATLAAAELPDGVRPLTQVEPARIRALLPPDTILLNEPSEIETFLDSLDREPPDWKALYGHDGHQHDERLFALNRERDEKRAARKGLQLRVTFLWVGELSEYDPKLAGFRIAIGPAMIPTRWGLVRFKAEELPGELVAVPSPALRQALRQRARDARVEVAVAMTGRLVPEESLIYDFAHEEPGHGLIMPVVRLDRLDYFLLK